MWPDDTQGDAKGLCGDEQNFPNRANRLGAEYMDVGDEHKGVAPAPHESAMK
jgi:hypothetical protein